MTHPHLAFCPYLSVRKVIEFADWELGPFELFEDRWADVKFKVQSKAFLAKFVDNAGRPIEHQSLLCRRGGQIDGELPSPEEIDALEAAAQGPGVGDVRAPGAAAGGGVKRHRRARRDRLVVAGHGRGDEAGPCRDCRRKRASGAR